MRDLCGRDAFPPLEVEIVKSSYRVVFKECILRAMESSQITARVMAQPGRN
jgi:hypothetical protein